MPTKTWRVVERSYSNRYGAVVRYHVTDGKLVSRGYDTKAAAKAVKSALAGNCELGGWATREAAALTGRLF